MGRTGTYRDVQGRAWDVHGRTGRYMGRTGTYMGPRVKDPTSPRPDPAFLHGPGPGPEYYLNVPGLDRDFNVAVWSFKENKKQLKSTYCPFYQYSIL